MPPPPPPPPPPGCFPFSRSRSSRSSQDGSAHTSANRPSLSRSDTCSSTSTLTSKAEKLTFASDSIIWDNVPIDDTTRNSPKAKPKSSPTPSPKGSTRGANGLFGTLSRSSSSGGKLVNSPPGMSRSSSTRSKGILSALNLGRNPSTSTLVGSALDRKIADAQIPAEPKVDTTNRLAELRKLMAKERIDYYVVPSTDSHGSEYLAASDKRRQWISGFTGSAGTAVISPNNAYLFVDSRYYVQAEREVDRNWTVMKVGWEGMKDWDDWLIDLARGVRIGVDSRLISYTQGKKLQEALLPRASSLAFPWQNLIDLIWKDRPSRPKNPVNLQPLQFAGEDAKSKLASIRGWIQRSAPETGRFTANPPQPAERPVAAFISDLTEVAWTLNMRGTDIMYNPVFQAYLFITADRAILFVDNVKLPDIVKSYLQELGVSTKEYSDVWAFLRAKDWGVGKVIITPEVPFTVPRSLTSARYLVAPSYVQGRKAIKNATELAGMERAYLRDGAAMVRWYAWLDQKIAEGFAITEYEASQRLTEYRSRNELYEGLAYENISACGSNAALPHYTPSRHDSAVVDRKTPYIMDAGGQYRDGTCDTTRTVHYGRPTEAQSEAYTRVLQGHIAIDSAVFPEGTTGAQLDVLARRALWKDGLNYLHGTGHGVGSYLSVHEGPLYFGRNVAFEVGHVISNEPGFYLEGEFGIRIESVLQVKRIQTKHQFQGNIWLGFERLTVVPIQVKMIKAALLSKEERAWVRNHNEECRQKLEPLLRDDSRALRWLRKECQPGFRSETQVSGFSVEWG
ncbi:Creatinase aminopeptidase [Hysterangium stoloniferum]|nr:Creatinase aminopeptidase [Hysterangium stoloniferum]